ncbi:MAG TPA: hypothetical protein VKB74_03290 [Burkholderiales bacterium]|nr:hypothetical protein [Burkholderiales bacterium]
MVKVSKPIEVKVRGKVIARIVPEENAAIAARKRLKVLRRQAHVGDVTGPSGARWNAERGRC